MDLALLRISSSTLCEVRWGGAGQQTPCFCIGREVLAAVLDREPHLAMDRPGLLVFADKGFASKEFEADLAFRGAELLRPSFKREKKCKGENLLKSVRQLPEPQNFSDLLGLTAPEVCVAGSSVSEGGRRRVPLGPCRDLAADRFIKIPQRCLSHDLILAD
ncbi:hypothetical protein ACIA98_17745 [Streptomyces sp. NPDC051366]|uniref:hypothetical protein n=1 Tax=Streptomyces sp. NPDC051366 TaxID=3365652 RepID=UPI0037A7FD23